MKTFYSGGFFYNPKTKEVLLHKRDGNTNVNPHKWGFFGGTSESNETSVQTFIREIGEELGVKLMPDDVIPLCDYPNKERKTHRYVFYVISNRKKSEMILGEGAGFDWIPVNKVFQHDLTSRTIDDLRRFFASKNP